MNKLKLLMPVVTAIAASPLAALCGCTLNIGGGDTPEPEFENVEIYHNTESGLDRYETDLISFKKNNYYKFYMNNFVWDDGTYDFHFYHNQGWSENVDVEIIEFTINDQKSTYTMGGKNYWSIIFNLKKQDNLAISLKFNEDGEYPFWAQLKKST